MFPEREVQLLGCKEERVEWWMVELARSSALGQSILLLTLLKDRIPDSPSMDLYDV